MFFYIMLTFCASTCTTFQAGGIYPTLQACNVAGPEVIREAKEQMRGWRFQGGYCEASMGFH